MRKKSRPCSWLRALRVWKRRCVAGQCAQLGVYMGGDGNAEGPWVSRDCVVTTPNGGLENVGVELYRHPFCASLIMCLRVGMGVKPLVPNDGAVPVPAQPGTL